VDNQSIPVVIPKVKKKVEGMPVFKTGAQKEGKDANQREVHFDVR
jgi:hypothetical protein